MQRIERLSRRIARSLCLLLLGAGMLASALAIRDGVTLSERIARDLGAFGWVLFAAVVAGAALQVLAGLSVLRGRAGGWAEVRWALILFVGTAIVHLVLYPRSNGLSVELFLGAWAGAFATAVLVLARWPRDRGSRVAFWLFQGCLALLLLEGGLRILARVAPSPLLVPEEGSVLERIEANSIKPGFVHFGFPHNSAGFYDEEFLPAAERTSPMVAVIGDSFSLSLVPHRAHYTTVCERELGDTLVYNIGVGACGPEEYRQLLLTDALPLEPDAVVVSLFLGNDLLDLRQHTAGKRIGSWFDRGNCLIYLVASRLLEIARERNRGGTLWSHRSNKLLRTEEELLEAFPWIADPRLDPGGLSEEAYLRMVRERIPVACDPDPVRVQALLDIVASMRDLAGRPFGVMLIPAEFQVEEALWTKAVAALDGRYDRDEPQKSIAAGLAELGIPCLDLLPLCRAAKPFEDGDRHLYRLRDSHFGILGNELAGRALAPFVRRLLR